MAKSEKKLLSVKKKNREGEERGWWGVRKKKAENLK